MDNRSDILQGCIVCCQPEVFGKDCAITIMMDITKDVFWVTHRSLAKKELTRCMMFHSICETINYTNAYHLMGLSKQASDT